jgi:hypothetical protein
MAIDTVAFDEVLRLARRLSPTEQARLQAALSATADEETKRALQRQKNQAAIDLLDEWRAEAAAATGDDDDDWWDEFIRDLDVHRMSSRPLFPDRTQR